MLLLGFCPFILNGQMASVTSGCAELKVEFTAPDNTSYFWDFGDESFSDLQNPIHSYIQADTYTVRLFDMEGGTQIGNSIEIIVYPEIEFEISADIVEGCVPLTVKFTSNITVHPDLEVEQVRWTFDDGGEATIDTTFGSSGQATICTEYTYNRTGVYDISLKVITKNNIKCDEPRIFERFINAEGANTAFTINKERICDVPAEFVVVNETFNDEGATYLWDFGDGPNSQTTERDPRTYIYEEEGEYTITLTTTTEAGCVTSFSKDIIVGSAIIDIANDTICKNVSTPIINETIADVFEWDFSQTDLERSFETDLTARSPFVFFSTSGPKQITLIAKTEDGCTTEEDIIIHVEQPNSNFSFDPVFTCLDTFTIGLNAEDSNMESYTWVNKATDSDGITTTNPELSIFYEQPIRDEYYYNSPDSIETLLIVKSQYGCIDTGRFALPIQKAESIFVPDVVTGCIPFDVIFTDHSFATDEINSREWDFGDNNTLSVSPNDTSVTHTYNEAGEFLVRLNITDEAGCADQSREVIINAINKEENQGGMITICPDCPPGDGMGGTVDLERQNCVGDMIGLGVFQDSIVKIHIETDDGRFNHCWENEIGLHTFLFPGEFSLAYTFEIDGILIDSIVSNDAIVIEGARSEIDYLYDCADPFKIQLNSDRCLNANVFRWYVNGTLISEEPNLEYTFSDEGTYTIALEVEDDGSGCTPHRDELEMDINIPEAIISMDAQFCDNQAYLLDASESQNVGGACEYPYLWEFENARPRKINQDTIQHTFKPGNQFVTLTVSNINGCTATASKEIDVYGIEPDISLDSTICINSPIQLTDLSTSDTSLVAWQWDFGSGSSSEQNPLYQFTEADEDPQFEEDTVTLNLILTDAIGCMDTLESTAMTYSINSNIGLDNSHNICIDGTINFTAEDFTDFGSFLNFSWDFEQLGVVEEQNPSMQFTESGEYNVVMTFTEESSGCTDMIDTLITVFETPIADFTTPFDDFDVICAPEQIPFTNTSFEDGPVLYGWDFGDMMTTSNFEDPVIPFDKGEWEVQFIVRSFYGCSDTISKTYKLVAPEGTFILDKTFICPGEEITLTLVDPVDVASFTWDLGDGTQINDENPITYTYNPQSSISMFNPTLIIRTDDNGCEETQNIPINLSSIDADFVDTTGVCPGEITMISSFTNPSNIVWDIDGQIIENIENPTVTLNSDADSIDILLRVTDELGCEIERFRRIENPDLSNQIVQFPNVFSPNGDSRNPFFNIIYDENNSEGDLNVTSFKVYNRWGELIYNNDNPAQGWNGFYKGEPAPPDVYAYFIEYTVENCVGKSKKGNVTVIR